jgi:hypothetical protein
MSRRRNNETYTSYEIETIRALKPEYVGKPRLLHRLPWAGTFEAYENRKAFVLNNIKGIGISIKGNRVDLIHIPSGQILTSLNKRMTPDINALLSTIEMALKKRDWSVDYDEVVDKEHRTDLRRMRDRIDKEYVSSLYYMP